MRLSHLTALAVLVALVGAMFVSMQPARATTGDVSANRGYCEQVVATPVGADDPAAQWQVLTARGDQASLGATVTASHVTVTDGDDEVAIACAEAFANLPVSVTPNNSVKPTVLPLYPTVTLKTQDSDNIFTNAVTNKVELDINLSNFDSDRIGTTAPQAQSVDVTGNLRSILAADSTTDEVGSDIDISTDAATIGTGQAEVDIRIAKGTSEDTYTITAAVAFDFADDYEDDAYTVDGDGIRTPAPDNSDIGSLGANEVLTASLDIQIGDAGTNVAAASIALAPRENEDPKTSKRESASIETGTKSVGQKIRLRLDISNSLGNPANSSGVTSVILFAAGGTLDAFKATALGKGDQVGSQDTNSLTLSGADALSAMIIEVGKAGSPAAPGQVNVRATVVGDNAVTTDTVTLAFAGSGASLTLGEPKTTSPNGNTEFSIGVADSSGNPLFSPAQQYIFVVKDAEGKSTAETAKINVEEGTVGQSTATVLDNNENVAAGIVTVAAGTKPGRYTVDVTIAGVPASTETVEVLVAGTATSVALSADPATGDAAEQALIKVTATVTDENGATVADGTLVEFSVLGLSLSAVGPGHSPIETVTTKQLVNVAEEGAPEYEERTLTTTQGGAGTKDGEVSVSFVATGAGTAVVSATTQGGSASGVLRISTTDSASDDAAADEEVSLGCLTETSGFSVYNCSAASSASELFALLSGRGATAIHLHNGSAWVRYSVVDGTMVPGSSDFMVAENDILYISN